MPDGAAITLWLAVIGICFIILAVSVLVLAVECHQTLRRVNALLPRCTRAVQEARLLLRRAHRTAGRLELIMNEVCETTTEAVNQVSLWGGRIRTYLTHRFGHVGNGARSEPRGR